MFRYNSNSNLIGWHQQFEEERSDLKCGIESYFEIFIHIHINFGFKICICFIFQPMTTYTKKTKPHTHMEAQMHVHTHKKETGLKSKRSLVARSVINSTLHAWNQIFLPIIITVICINLQNKMITKYSCCYNFKTNSNNIMSPKRFKLHKSEEYSYMIAEF